MTYRLDVKARPESRAGHGEEREGMPLQRADCGAVDLDVCARIEVVSSRHVTGLTCTIRAQTSTSRGAWRGGEYLFN